MKKLGRYSIGTGDRFGHEGRAQIEAVRKARGAGVEAAIVWNKSNREHTIIGTEPRDTMKAAEAAIKSSGWDGEWHVDADHIGLATVDRFMASSDFFTIDVADFISQAADPSSVESFVKRHGDLCRQLAIPGLSEPIALDSKTLAGAASRYLNAAHEAARIYHHIEKTKGAGGFIAEVSMDETAQPQSPTELLVILAALADEGVAIQTIAPKFSGRFNKGVDYVGDVSGFLAEFEADVCVATWAAHAFGLPGNLKLSIHSGSDKFSLYKGIGHIIRRHNAGVHLKTAGTNWLEELVGLGEGGDEGLSIVKELYHLALPRFDELTAPYSTVIDIDRIRLPSAQVVDAWTSDQFTAALRHVQTNPAYDRNFRQLLHVAFRLAAEMGTRYLDALKHYREPIERNVTANLWERHITPLFLD
jgi:hypothetical protein